MNKRASFKQVGLIALMLIFVVITIQLGFWQLRRAALKEQLQAQFDWRQQQAPIELDIKTMAAEKAAFQNVMFEGEVDNQRTFLLDNSVRQGKAGYEVISPVTTAQGVLLINRGWVQGNPDRSQLPRIPVLMGKQLFSGYLYVPLKPKPINVTITPWQWPQVISDIDVAFIGSRLHQTVFPYTIRLREGSDPAFLQQWINTSTMSSSKHVAYAVQWFLIAAILSGFVFYLCLGRKR